MIAGYVALAVLAAALLYVLHFLGRVKELHHGYYGLALIAAAPLLSHDLALLVGALGGFLYGDDLYQHGVEAVALSRGEPVPADFTLVHKLGALIVGAWDRR